MVLLELILLFMAGTLFGATSFYTLGVTDEEETLLILCWPIVLVIFAFEVPVKTLIKMWKWSINGIASFFNRDDRTELERMMEDQFGHEDLSGMEIGADRDLRPVEKELEEEKVNSKNVKMVPERDVKESLHEYMFEGCVEFSPDRKRRLCEKCGDKFEGDSNKCETCRSEEGKISVSETCRSKENKTAYHTPYGSKTKDMRCKSGSELFQKI